VLLVQLRREGVHLRLQLLNLLLHKRQLRQRR
jgi:hypothetical protein